MRFTVFDKNNTTGINTHRFTTLFEDAGGDLWLGTESGSVTRYRRGRFTSWATKQGNPIEGFTQDEQGRLLVVSSAIMRFDPASDRFIDIGAPRYPSGYHRLLWQERPRCWSTDQTALHGFDGSRWTSYPLPRDLPGNAIGNAAEAQPHVEYRDVHGNVWSMTLGPGVSTSVAGETAMTRRILLCVGMCAAGAACMAQTAPPAAAPQAALDQVRIDVVNKRLPVAEAVKHVEQRFGRVVTYEDVPHVAASDLADITDQVASGQSRTKRVIVPRSDSIRLAYTSRYATLDDQAGEALTHVPAVWNGGADRSGKFRVERVAGGYHVIPVASKGPGETMEPYTSPLDTPITVPMAERDGVETFSVLVQAIADSSRRPVHAGGVPYNRLSQFKVTIGAEHQIAREVLWKALQAMDPALSWQLRCNVGESECAIYLHFIGQ